MLNVIDVRNKNHIINQILLSNINQKVNLQYVKYSFEIVSNIFHAVKFVYICTNFTLYLNLQIICFDMITEPFYFNIGYIFNKDYEV